MKSRGGSADTLVSFKVRRAKDERPLVLLRRRLRRAFTRYALRRAFATVAFGRKAYQPLTIGGRQLKATREFEGRWRTVSKVLTEYRAASVLDIGCAEGWLVRKAATELGCFAIGVEATDRLVAGEIARLHDDVGRMSIMRAMLMPEDIRRLPRFDVVICLSVVHHVIRAHGMEVGRDFVRALATRAEKAIIFEMGTSEEKVGSAPRYLPDMPKGQDAFIREFLESAGLTRVRLIAESVGYGDNPRRIFAAEPPGLAAREPEMRTVGS
jgi:SAM-dependent methyltransferase